MSMRIPSFGRVEDTHDVPAPVSGAEDRAMREAIRIAKRGIGTTHPNPRVGAIVLRGSEIVGRGYHARAGEAHAEVRALETAGREARGATLVTTLEPCAHQGRTPPCVEAVLDAGIRRVVLGQRDPNPLVNGRGVAALRAAGVEVAEGIRGEECAALNPPYLKFLATGLPWVLLKAMVSLDGRVATDAGDSRGLGGPEQQRLSHALRTSHDAVLVGIGTVLEDDPELTVRLRRGRNPARVVLDSDLRIPPGSRLVATAGRAPLIVATTRSDRDAIETLEARGARVWTFPPAPDGRVPLADLLRRLAAEGMLALLVEGGPTVHTSFLRERLADRVAIGVAPVLVGGATAPAWTRDLGLPRLQEALELTNVTSRRVGRDLWIEGSLRGADHV